MKRISTALSAVIGAMSLSTVAGAQNVDSSAPTIGSMFARNRSLTVTERTIPGYSRKGVRVGAVIVRPEVSIGIFFTDNLYATENDRVADAAFTIAPSVSALLSDSTTSYSLVADGQINRYFSRMTENTSTYGVAGRGRHELGEGFWVAANGAFRHQIERRSDPGAIIVSISPIEYDIVDARGEFGWEKGRLRVSGGGGAGRLRFTDGQLADGSILSQDYRDRDTARANIQGDYALTANVALRLQGNYARSNYNSITSFDRLDRSSDRYELLGGATFEFSDLLRGEIGLGYINLKYDSAVFTAFSGFGGRAQIEYLPTQLTTVTLRASRTIEEAGVQQSPTYLRTTTTLSVDHELYRNVILTGYVGYSSNEFRQPTRSDRRLALGTGVTYRFSDRVSLYGRYDCLGVTARPEALGRSLTLNAASVGLNIGI